MSDSKIFVKITALFLSAVPFLLSLWIRLSFRTLGFPDGHLTEYDLATALPMQILFWSGMIFAALCFYKALKVKEKKELKFFVVAVTGYVFFFLSYYFGLSYYFKEIINLNYGQGG